MITKGTTHNSGGKLAHYMVTGKDGERAELWQLRGFAFDDIKEAFRSVHVMAEGTRCLQPFFHVQVRNPEGETLNRTQWEYTANRIEARLGLADQPRAIAFHVDEKTGHEHMHIAWSRIDDETLTARPLPFFKDRLKKISRELELHFGLRLVRNTRPDQISYAPTRAEDEQARRLGVNIHEIRQTIRDCYEHSDCGRSFEAALATEGMVLAKGDKRDFIVIDPAGGMHAVGKRILDVSAVQIRQRLGDLDREQLPTVEQAREAIPRLQLNRDKAQEGQVWDRDRYDTAWNDAVMRAAIEQEKIARRFVEPKQSGRGDREKVQGTEGRPEMPAELQGAAAQIWKAYQNSPDARTFAETLDREHGITLAAATKEEADRSYREASFAREIGNFAPTYRAGEIVAVTESSHVTKLNKRTTGEDRENIEKFLEKLDRKQLPSIAGAKGLMHERADAAIKLFSLLNPVRKPEIDVRPAGRLGRAGAGENGKRPIRVRAGISNAGERLVGGMAEGIAGAFDSLFGAPLTPEKKREIRVAARDREADAEEKSDFAAYLAERERVRQLDEEREAARRRQRDDRER
jgi:hypothetical protein